MALYKGSLFAGKLFAGKLFGQQIAEKPKGVGGRNRHKWLLNDVEVIPGKTTYINVEQAKSSVDAVILKTVEAIEVANIIDNIDENSAIHPSMAAAIIARRKAIAVAIGLICQSQMINV